MTVRPLDVEGQTVEENDRTLAEVIAQLEGEGFEGQFRARDEGSLECLSCHTISAAREVHLERVERLEGASDPADEVVVAGLACPVCHAKGTATFAFGPMAPAAEAAAFRRLQDDRR